MKKLILVFLTNLVFLSTTFAVEMSLLKNSLGIDWGTNYWGNTFSLLYRRKVTRNFSLGLGFSKGSFNFVQKANSTMFGVDYSGDEDLKVNIQIKRIIDFAFYLNRTTNKNLSFLNTYGLGLSHFFVTFKESMEQEGIPGTFEGEKDFSKYALYLLLNIMEFKPKNLEGLSFSLGLKSHFTLIDYPQTLTLYNGDESITWTLYDGKNNILPYVEAYLKFSYMF